jgi:hypothetical protein
MKTTVVLTALLMSITSSTLFAATISPISYEMPNGNGQASSANYNYWDKAYSGSGNTTTDGAYLSGGLGDLTDGIVTFLNWNNTENNGGTGPYVGWADINPTIIFHFASSVNISSISIHADDSAGLGGVNLPTSVAFNGGTPFSVVDPDAGSNPSYLIFSNLSLTGTDVSITLNRGNRWVFVDEISFNATPVPVPESYAMFLTGFVGLVAVTSRRRNNLYFALIK